MTRKQAVRALFVVTLGYALYAVVLLLSGARYDPSLSVLMFDCRDAWAWLANSTGSNSNRTAVAVDVVCIVTPLAALVAGWPRKADKPKPAKDRT